MRSTRISTGLANTHQRILTKRDTFWRRGTWYPVRIQVIGRDGWNEKLKLYVSSTKKFWIQDALWVLTLNTWN